MGAGFHLPAPSVRYGGCFSFHDRLTRPLARLLVVALNGFYIAYLLLDKSGDFCRNQIGDCLFAVKRSKFGF